MRTTTTPTAFMSGHSTTTPAATPGCIHAGDALHILPTLPAAAFQLIIADPPYHRVLEKEPWDNAWKSDED